jgi:hypothetical protein
LQTPDNKASPKDAFPASTSPLKSILKSPGRDGTIGGDADRLGSQGKKSKKNKKNRSRKIAFAEDDKHARGVIIKRERD